jgi:hypothetical protein
MSLFYNNNAGVLLPISGLNGELVIGASTIRTGSKTSETSSWSTQETGTFIITFNEPMPDADYVLDITMDKTGISHEVTEKTKNGFKCQVMNIRNSTIPSTITISYRAFKLYTDVEYNNLNTVSTGTVTLDSTYVTSGTCTYMKCGHIVTARVSALTLKSGVVPGTVLGTGLPPLPDGFHRAIVAKGDGVSPCVFIRATSNGTLMADSGCDGATSLYGDFTYICQ